MVRRRWQGRRERPRSAETRNEDKTMQIQLLATATLVALTTASTAQVLTYQA